MANKCPDCERLEIKPVGTAPDRTHFMQPTMYDHYGNFQKFKKLQEEEAIFMKRKAEILKRCGNFTNFDFSHILTRQELEQLSPEDIEKFRQYLGFNSCEANVSSVSNTDKAKQKDDLNVSFEDSEDDNKTLRKRKSLSVLTRTPIQCPISVCNRTIGVTFVLSHYLRDHSEDFGVPCQEIYADKRSVLIFDPTILTLRENFCLGILAYGGDANESSSRPSERGLCIHNAFLPQPYEHLATHLPILIMACRTSWSDLLVVEKEKQFNLDNPNHMNQELLVLWLASPQTVNPIHGTLTVYDKSMAASRSGIMQIRDLNETQIPREFMLNATNFIALSHGEINILSQQRTECIHMEIMINEY